MNHSIHSSRLDTWKQAWALPAIRRQFLLTIPALVAVLFIFSRFVLFIEERPGVVLPDPILGAFEAHDATWPIFGLIYGSLLVGFFYLLSHPHALLVALQAYIIMMSVRMVVMYLAPLDPPDGIIPLVDPFAAAGTGTVLLKDLFFSGHTATLFLLFLTARVASVRMIFLTCTILTGALLMLQHVHYSIDVAAAPFFAYTSYRAAVWFERRMGIQRGAGSVRSGSS